MAPGLYLTVSVNSADFSYGILGWQLFHSVSLKWICLVIHHLMAFVIASSSTGGQSRYELAPLSAGSRGYLTETIHHLDSRSRRRVASLFFNFEIAKADTVGKTAAHRNNQSPAQPVPISSRMFSMLCVVGLVGNNAKSQSRHEEQVESRLDAVDAAYNVLVWRQIAL